MGITTLLHFPCPGSSKPPPHDMALRRAQKKRGGRLFPGATTPLRLRHRLNASIRFQRNPLLLIPSLLGNQCEAAQPCPTASQTRTCHHPSGVSTNLPNQRILLIPVCLKEPHPRKQAAPSQGWHTSGICPTHAHRPPAVHGHHVAKPMPPKRLGATSRMENL